MSFESGRKLGVTSSLIAVVTPVIGVISVVFFIVSIIANAFSNLIGTNQNTYGFSALSIGFLIFAIILGIVSFAGVVLFIVAMHRLAEYYHEAGIFKNALYGFLMNIVGIIISFSIYAVFIVTSLGNIPRSTTTQTTATITPSPTIPPNISSILAQFFTGYIILVAVSLVLAIISAVFYMRAFNKLGEKSEVDNFKTAGLLYLLGGALAIVGIGALLSWIAWIFAFMGFRSLKPKTTQTTPSPSSIPQITPNTIQRKYCSYCGTENNSDALYCRFCGKQLQ